MKGKKRGVSSILGALIFLQILLISLLLVIHVINNETNITLKSVQRFQALSENAPIEEEVENNITYLYSTTPFVITHIIYPNGQIINTSIVVNNRYPISQILNGFPWAIIVTSKGTWYNVTPLGDSNYGSGLIAFPYYHNYGMPLDPSVLNLYLPTNLALLALGGDYPNWSVLEGIASPSAFSLAPVNVTIGDPTTYSWAITDAVLVFYPLSPDGWINITYYLPMQYKFGVYSQLLFDKYVQYYQFYWYQINGSIGVYIPINVSAAIALNPANAPNNTYITQNVTFLQYVFIYDGNGEITNFTYSWNGWQPIGYSWTYTQIGYTYEASPYQITSYPLLINPQRVFGVTLGLDLPSSINLPPQNWFEGYFSWDFVLQNIVHTKFNPPFDYGQQIIPIEYIPLTVYQVDINLHKGEVLDYAYDSYNNSWLLLFNWTFNYNNPAMYIKAYKSLSPPNDYFPFGHYNSYYGYVFLYNINNIEYLTEYPVYVVVPEGVYLLQVSLS